MVWRGGPEAASGLVAPPALPAEPGRPGAEVAAVFFLAAAAYLALAGWAILGHNLVMGDAISRLANASYALRGRDPHLEAIGFVWNPLPTLAMMVLLPARSLWSSLANPGLAASMVSALFMAGSVAATVRLLRRWGLSRAGRLLGGFALGANPLMLFYAVNGMSETMFVFFLVLAVGGLADWLTDRRSTSLLVAATALGACYLVRYEAIAAAGAAVTCVAAVSLASAWRQQRERAVSDALGHGLITALPVVFTFVGFAGASWLITGSPFEQFTSQYGNSAVLAASSSASSTLGSRVLFGFGELTGAAPLLVVAMAAVLLTARGVWAWRALATTSIFGGVLALSALLNAAGSTLPFLRFWIAAVPLQVLLGAIVIHRWPDTGHRRWKFGAAALAGAVAVSATAVSGAATWSAMKDPTFGRQEHQLASVIDRSRDRADERQTLRLFAREREVAAYLDLLRLRRGTVLLDVLNGFPIVLASRNPDQFVLPSDRDYATVEEDPAAHGVVYLLTVPPTGRGTVDSVNRRFPGIYETGATVATLVMQTDPDGPNPGFRLYQLNRQTAP